MIRMTSHAQEHVNQLMDEVLELSYQAIEVADELVARIERMEKGKNGAGTLDPDSGASGEQDRERVDSGDEGTS